MDSFCFQDGCDPNLDRNNDILKMDENKRDANKIKRTRNDHVKLALTNYLQRRNYPFLQVSTITVNELLMRSLVHSEFSRANSILYSCYNSDPVVIDLNFTKFLMWLKDLIKNKKVGHDLENLVPPLFCHLYLDILKGGHSERASAFFKVHSPTIEKINTDDLIKNLMNSFANDNVDTVYKDHFRGNKYSINLSPISIQLLKKFVAENCHVVFLQELQNWFDIQETKGDNNMTSGERIIVPFERDNFKFQELRSAINELKNEPRPLFCINVGNTKDDVNCGVIKRESGIIAYSQRNSVRVRSIHPYDSILCHRDTKELSFHGHEGNVYCVAISDESEYLVTGGNDKNVCIYDLINAELLHVCKGHLGPVYSIAISNPPSFVASGSYDGTVRLWSTDKGHLLRVFIGHSQPIICCTFHPNNIYLATGSADRTVRLWNLESGKSERLLCGAKGTVYTAVFHPSGHYVASASDDKCIHIWDVLHSKMILELRYKEDLVMKLIWSKDGRFLAAGTLNGVYRLWDVDSIRENNSVEMKVYEPCSTIRLHAKLLDIEYSCNSFTCLTAERKF